VLDAQEDKEVVAVRCKEDHHVLDAQEDKEVVAVKTKVMHPHVLIVQIELHVLMLIHHHAPIVQTEVLVPWQMLMLVAQV
jgi:hypothetical protein